jgi:signal transduction histidine kinase
MEEHLRKIVELSLGSSPEEMLKASLDTCIELSGASGGSILGEEGPYLQFLFSDVPELIGVHVPFDSIAGATVTKDRVIYTYAPADKRHYDGVDDRLQRATRYLLSVPIPSVHRKTSADQAIRNAGALQLLFDRDLFPGTDVTRGPQEFEMARFKENEPFMYRLKGVFWMLPVVAFAVEVMKLRQTSYQAIHELKNKLIGGQSWLNYLKEDIRQKAEPLMSDETIVQDFELAESAIREGAELAKTYLQFTKLYSPTFAPVNIREVLDETAASVRALAIDMKASDLRVTVDLNAEIPVRNLDAGQLKMAFFNLCKNAVEALLQHQTPHPEVQISCVPAGERLRITVADNGPGMPPEIADNLFVAFKTKKEGGTGLGLTITKKIVDVHGGAIKCETGKNGTRFTVLI